MNNIEIPKFYKSAKKEYSKEVRLWNAGWCVYHDHMGDDITPLVSARMSTGNPSGESEQKDAGSRNFLWRHGHVSPFEQAVMTVIFQVPIPVARQLIRHRSLCLSGDAELYFDLPGAIKNGKRANQKRTIRDFHNSWEKSANTKNRKFYENMMLRMCDEKTGEILHTNIKDIWISGEKDVYEIELKNGYKIKTTKEHRFLFDDGWKSLEEATGLYLSDNSKAIWRHNPNFSVNGEPCHQNYEWMKSKRDAGMDVQEIADAAGVGYHTIRKWLRILKLTFTRKERGILSGRAQKGQKRQRCRKKVYSEAGMARVKAARSGENSNFWKGGVSKERERIGRWTTDQAQRVHEKFGYKCVICDSKEKLHAHHIDPVWNNSELATDFDNLISLCQKCHSQVHVRSLELEFLNDVKSGTDISEFLLKYDKGEDPQNKKKFKSIGLVRKYSELKNITYAGKEITYDLEVTGPYHNFVANGFIVHNCVNEHSQRYSEPIEEFYVPSMEYIRYDNEFNKQMSGRPVDEDLAKEYIEEVTAEAERSRQLYKKYREKGISKERIRDTQPVSGYTRIMATANLRDWLFFLSKRLKNDAQQEIRDLSDAIYVMLQDLFPLCCEVFEEYTLHAETLSRTELKVLEQWMEKLSSSIDEGKTESDFDDICARNNLNKSRTRELKAKMNFGF